MAEWYDAQNMGSAFPLLDYGSNKLANYANQNLGNNQNQNNSGLSWWMNQDRSRYPSPLMPEMLDQTGQMGASNYVPPQPIGGTDIDMQYTTGNEFNIPPRGNILSRFATGAGNVASDLVSGAGNVVSGFATGAGNIKDRIGGGISRLLDNTMLGKIASVRDATNKRAANYNPALQGQIDYLQSSPEVAGATLGHGATRAGNKITGGSLYGQNLQSMYGSNDLIDMYNKQIARHTKTIEGFADQWGKLKEENPAEYKRRIGIHQQRRKWAQAEKDAVIAGTTGGGVEGGQTAGMRGQLGRAENAADRRNIQQIQQHTGRELSGYRMDRPSSERQFTGHGRSGMGRSADRFAAEGGRIGYRDGEFVDEDINIQGPGFDVNENVEMAEANPFQLRIQELMSKGLSWEDAYDIAAQEFQDEFAEGPEESFSEDQGIASLV